MALTATLYALQIELSDTDRHVYESLSLRVAQHPSEDGPRLVARALAYALLYEEDLEFGRGLSNADEPALWVRHGDGRVAHWIDVGHPQADRMHRASKGADRLTIVCHKDPDALRREAAKRSVHGADAIAVWLLPPDLVAGLAEATGRKSQWTVMFGDGELMVTVDDASEPLTGTVERATLASL